MDGQVAHLVTELARDFAGLDGRLRAAGVTVDDASDDVVYEFERPGSVFDARNRRLPRTDVRVQATFAKRRKLAHSALGAYRKAHPGSATAP